MTREIKESSAMKTTLTPWRPGLGMTSWDNASNYVGEHLDGWFIFSKHRDSDLLTESNFDAILAALNDAAIAAGNRDCVQQPCVNHWTVGWVEQLCLAADAPESVIREAEGLLARLEDYPALDEDDWSEREWNAAADFWDSLSPRDKAQTAIYERKKRHWLTKAPAWRIGRMDWHTLANDQSELGQYVYEHVRESCQ